MDNLDSMVAQLGRAERFTCTVCNGDVATNTDIFFGDVAVVRAAFAIETRAAEVMSWYQSAKIFELGNLTAEKLVSMGRSEEVVDFLLSISAGERD